MPTPQPPPITLPLFNPSDTSRSGLSLLAAVAAQSRASSQPQSVPAPHPQAASLSQPGSYSPGASLLPKLVKRILNLEFIEISEITMDDPTSLGTGRPAPPRLPVADISQWVERYSAMAAIIATRFPHKAPELFAYQALIVRAERNYETNRWVSYDRQFRREALARKDLNWSIPDARLYNEAFTGRARSIARCVFCLQDEHRSDLCPRNPNRSWLGMFQDASMLGFPNFRPPPSGQPTLGMQREVCRRFNRGTCYSARCRYSHACSTCHAPHPVIDCPRNHSRRNRWPNRQPPRRDTAATVRHS